VQLDRQDWVLIQRYITGSATTEEGQKVKQWMTQDPENRKLIRDLKKIWDLTPEEDFEVDIQQAWSNYQARRKKGSRVLQMHTVTQKKSNVIYHAYRAVAFIMVAAVAGFFSQNISTMQSESDLVIDRSHFYTMQELSTGPGEKARVTFSDGTKVTLNSSSSISFPREFHGSTREVYLEGEAYFNVASDSGHSFIVHANHVDVEVLGTEFNVRGWSSDEIVDVIVREGKVSVRSIFKDLDDGAEVILTEGFKTIVKAGQAPESARQVNVINNLLWMTGGLHFDNIPFGQVAIQLERRFNVNITIADDELLDVPYTGTFQYAELDEVLMVIAASMEIEFIRDRMDIEFSNPKSDFD
jgi:transmembrane sensor